MKSFAARAIRVSFDDAGLVSAAPTRRQELDALVGMEIGPLRRDGIAVPGRFEPAVIDVDEVAQQWSAPGVATIEIRHTFVAGWRTRIVVADLSGAPWTATLHLGLRPGPEHRLWRLAVGAGGALALIPAEPSAAILAVRSGPGGPAIQSAEDAGALEIGPYRLAAGERFVTSWEWSSARHPRELAAQLRSAWPVLPRRSVVAVEEEITLPADPDTALVVPSGVEQETLGDRVALAAAEPGRHRVELRSARGSTTLDLAWTLPPADFLAAVAEGLLAAAPGKSGVVALPGLDAAIVVQRAARTAGFPARAAAEDALDQFTARLDPDAGGPADAALAAVYLAGEYDRLGDPDLIERATAATAGIRTPVPGLGLAVVRTVLASVLAGSAPTVRLPTTVAPAAPTRPADLELLFATRPPDLLLGDDAVAALLYQLGIDLDAGLPGRPSDDRDPDEVAYDLALLRLVPDGFGAWWYRRFGGSVAEFVEERSLELVDRLGSAPLSRAHAWLALGS